MKNLYRKGKIHPSPPQLDPLSVLRTLPATILALAATLLPEDREVLAYLLAGAANIDGRKNKHTGHGKHPPLFQCTCFQCYTSFWVRWDSSPNRQLIHEIIDAFEESLQIPKPKKGRRGGSREKRFSGENLNGKEKGGDERVEEVDGKDGENGEDCCQSENKSSVRRFVSFIGEHLWRIWNTDDPIPQ